MNKTIKFNTFSMIEQNNRSPRTNGLNIEEKNYKVKEQRNYCMYLSVIF